MQDLIKYINFKNSLFQFSLFITLFGLVALADLLVPTVNLTERSEYIFKFIITFLTGGAVFFMLRYGFGLTMTNPSNFLVSTWIVYLLLHPTNNIWYFPLAIIMIAVGKFLFRRMKQPIFNPAALAIVLTYVVTYVISLINPQVDTLLVSWWGADMFQNMLSSLPILNVVVSSLFLILFFYFANSFKKASLIFSFFLSFLTLTFFYTVITLSLERATHLVAYMLFNATAFAALVMIPEPKTSPSFPLQQKIIGMLAGIALFVSNNFLTTLPVDPLINTVIFANILTLLVKIQQTKPKAPATNPSPAPQQNTQTPTQPVQPTTPPRQPVNQNTQNIA